jgi:hypothetical protein
MTDYGNCKYCGAELQILLTSVYCPNESCPEKVILEWDKTVDTEPLFFNCTHPSKYYSPDGSRWCWACGKRIRQHG